MKNLTKLLALSLCFCLFALTTFAQTPKVLSLAGEYTLEANAPAVLIHPNFQQDEYTDMHVVRYMEFHSLPNLAEKIKLESFGIKFLAYMPYNTYVVALPKTLNTSLLTSYNIRSLHSIKSDDKINRQLYSRPFASHAIEGNKVIIKVQFYDHLKPSSVFGKLASEGYLVKESGENQDWLMVGADDNSIMALADLPYVRYIELKPEPGKKEDDMGKSLNRSNIINSHIAGGLRFDGTGVNIAVNDDGDVEHIDIHGRDRQLAGGLGGTHGDGVTGIACGAPNLNPKYGGMAPGAGIFLRSYNANMPGTVTLFNSDTVVAYNSSYSNGCNAGYTATTELVDREIHQNLPLIQIFSAGNSNNNDCGYGAGNQWGNITGGHKMGKNVMATANLFPDATLVASSSRGPANDGRIKPDISANGQNQVSLNGVNGYAGFGGTSGAAPNIMGVFAQLHHYYKTANSGTMPESGLIKAAMLNTAYDLGNAGPDFIYGWGRVDAHAAYNLLKDNRYMSGTISNNGTASHSITVPAGVEQVRIMTYWTDRQGSTTAALALVNDIDTDVSIPGGGTAQVWHLDPSPNATTLALPATRNGLRDSLNNVEQVMIDNPAAGTYTLNVRGANVPFGPQKYWVLYEFIYDDILLTYPYGGESVTPGETERLRWDAFGNTGTFVAEYSTNGGTTWTPISNSVPGNRRYVDWTIPNNVTNQARVRVSRGGNSSQSAANFNIYQVPANLQVSQVCPTYTKLTWNAIPGAAEYHVFQLGNKYMDTVGNTTATTFDVMGTDPNVVEWFSVRGIGPGGIVGERAIAINDGTGLSNCVVADDISAVALLQPALLTVQSCRANNQSVEMIIQNTGINAQSNFEVGYQLTGQPVVIDTFVGTLNPGATDTILFTQPFTLSAPGAYNLKVWTSLMTDGAPFNDTLNVGMTLLNAPAESLPYSEDFETFINCSTANSCGAVICGLSNGWINSTNGTEDDMDWRTHNGPSPSNGNGPTGPTQDFNPGNANGKYLYTEASNGCNFVEGHLVSPCIDLVSALVPEMTFRRHMFGGQMGDLHVDVFNGTTWTLDVIPVITDNQDAWVEETVVLTPFIGQVINIRFRGETGGGWQSDMALDDINIVDNAAPPAAGFATSGTSGCVTSTFALTDQSSNNPTGWNWSITPGTFSFVNGTSSSTQNPEVQFSAVGVYSVKLVVSNAFGMDSVTLTSLITITNGAALPLMEDFNLAAFPPSNWSIDNPDPGTPTWTRVAGVTGIGGTATGVALYDNYNTNSGGGQEDRLVSFIYDLNTVTTATLAFDVAHAEYGLGSNDALRVDISTDCGSTWGQIYSKAGSALATTNATTAFFQPTAANQWRREYVDLNSYVGNSAMVRFVNIGAFGNNIYLDNINISNASTPPGAGFASNPFACINNSTTISDASSGIVSSYNWDFGTGATPATATTAGPHNVTYSSVGIKTIRQIVSNSGGTDTLMKTIEVVEPPMASFNANGSTGFTYNFVDLSTGGGLTWAWDFGDGSSSNLQNPSHSYAGAGAFTVILVVTNACGSNTFTMNINPTVTTHKLSDLLNVDILPNPNNGLFEVELSGTALGSLNLGVYSTTGKLIKALSTEMNSSSKKISLDLRTLPSGIYLLELSGKNGSMVQKVVIR